MKASSSFEIHPTEQIPGPSISSSNQSKGKFLIYSILDNLCRSTCKIVPIGLIKTVLITIQVFNSRIIRILAFCEEPPPCTVDFLTPLRNNFKEIISPKLDIHAKKALQEETDPRELDAIRAKKVKYAILEAVYGKKFFCYIQ